MIIMFLLQFLVICFRNAHKIVYFCRIYAFLKVSFLTSMTLKNKAIKSLSNQLKLLSFTKINFLFKKIFKKINRTEG